MRCPVFVFLLFGTTLSYGQTPSDTLTGQVAVWSKLPVRTKGGISVRQALKGATLDLSTLDIQAYTLAPGREVSSVGQQEDQLIIVKDGNLAVAFLKEGSIKDRVTFYQKILRPGGVGLFSSGAKFVLENRSERAVSYYIFFFRSRGVKDSVRAMEAGNHFFMDWPEMVMKQTDKGESRPIFSRPTAWLGKIDMHATTLNKGQVSHAPHVHRAEEIILLRSGEVQEYINGKYYKATAGDLIFLPSGSLHALENLGSGRCEYFALQWGL